jgi:hypothetical protein
MHALYIDKEGFQEFRFDTALNSLTTKSYQDTATRINSSCSGVLDCTLQAVKIRLIKRKGSEVRVAENRGPQNCF